MDSGTPIVTQSESKWGNALSLGPVVELSPLTADPAAKLARQAPRPWYLRQPGYDDAFDWHTIFYDVFRAADNRHVVLVGPPLRNLSRQVCAMVETAFGVVRSDMTIRTLDRTTEIWLTSPNAAAAVDAPWTRQGHVAVQPNGCELFRGRRVLFTKSKDNDLQWIRDWAHFFALKHGCDAVLFYDNESTRYSVSDVHRTLSSVPGLEVVVVIGWNYKFGPGGGESKQWDSDFSQYGALEHARHRFLAFAEACVHADIDELVVTDDRSTVFDRVLGSRTGLITYRGVWIENVRDEQPDAPRRHSQFRFRLPKAPTPVGPKWAVDPSRCPPSAQWRVHDVSGMRSDARASKGVLTRHFRAINTNWKFVRWEPAALTPQHFVDTELAAWFDGLND